MTRVYYFFFFFSSRRRHTRFDCDWSSDVCSSDLEAARAPEPPQPGLDRPRGRLVALAGRRRGPGRPAGDDHLDGHLTRSEERRVGKECRSRWWPDHYKKKVRMMCK